jgi:hypothetical protein
MRLNAVAPQVQPSVERAEIDVLGELREVMLRIEKIENALRPTQTR